MDRFTPGSAADARRVFDLLDPTFAELWSSHVTQLMERTELDSPTRFLVLVAQHTVTERHEQLADVIGAALEAGVDGGDMLEIILQTYVYMGPWVVAAAVEVFRNELSTRNVPLPDLAARLRDPGSRSLEVERDSWSDRDTADPRLEGLVARYGWHAISNGLRLRPGHHINMVATLDALDPHFLRIWLDAVYDGMYGRGVLDDRTRLLCVVGATLALGETHQSRRHMRASLRAGAEPREVLEVIFQTTAFFGHPYVMPAAFDDLLRILEDEGRITELLAEEQLDDVMRIVAARVARRDGVQDDIGEL